MTERRLSPRLGAYAAFAAILMILAVGFSRMELFAMAAPFLCAVLLGLGTARRSILELRREVGATRVFEGEPITVTVTAHALTDCPLVEIVGPVPEGAAHVEGSSVRLLSLRAGEERRLRYSFRMDYRCRFELGPVKARVHAASGEASWETEAGGWLGCVVYPSPFPLRSRLAPRRTRSHAGSYPSRVAGEGIDFLGLRPFAPGDHTRRINWRATARRDALVVNQRAAERNADIVLVVDVLSETGMVGRSVLDASARGVATLARYYLREKNRVGYIELGHYIHFVFPASSRRQWYRILELLADLRVRERYLSFELESVPARMLPPGALVIGFGSLANARWTRALVELKRRGYDVVIVAPWAPDAARLCLPDAPDVRLALRVWELEHETAVSELRRVGVPCVPWRAGDPLDLVIRAVDRVQRRSGR